MKRFLRIWLLVIYACLPVLLPASPYAYVVNQGSQTISVIDLANNTLVQSLGAGFMLSFPQWITINPSGHYAYVSNGNNSISVIDISDPTNNLFVQFLSFPNFDLEEPGPATFTSNGNFAYVPSSNPVTGMNVTVINTSDPTNNTLAQNVTGAPFNFFNPQTVGIAGNFAYVSNPTGSPGGSVTVMNISDPTNNTYVTTLSGVPNIDVPFGIAITGTHAFVTNIGNDSVTVIDTTNNTFIQNLIGGSFNFSNARFIAISGNFAYALNEGNNSVTVINTSNYNFVANLLAGYQFNTPRDIAFSGNFAYVTNNGSNSITVFDTTNNSFVANLAAGLSLNGPIGIAITGTPSPPPPPPPSPSSSSVKRSLEQFLYNVDRIRPIYDAELGTAETKLNDAGLQR